MRRAGVVLDVPRRQLQGERRANVAQQNLALARLEAECCKARSGIRVRLLRNKVMHGVLEEVYGPRKN